MFARISTFLLVILSGATALANGPMMVEPTRIFVPNGFDTNDQSEVLLSGWLPTPCFMKPEAEVQVDGRNININLKSHAKSGGVCITMAYPFLVKANLGRLGQGQYRINVNEQSSADPKATIRINPTTSNSIDDFIYAHVDDVHVDPTNDTVVLTGYNPSDCVTLDLIHYTSNESDTIAILPIMKKVQQSCEKKLVPFRYTFGMPRVLPEDAKEFLLHVRSLEGSSVNKLVRM
ncbi:MAG: hypothetical protein O2897_02205 [bacterium]|nr:hypothetical protein [bacterium]